MTSSGSGQQPITVGALTALIRNNLETSFPSVLVEGELTGVKLASSGHLYFGLRDSSSLIQGVMFRFKAQSLDFAPSDGQKVIARGSISVYGPRGQYQLIASSLRTSGLGDLLEMIDERKRRLAAEGLFDQDRKKALPRFPERIGVVTSPSGAALKDILSILKRRNSTVDILIYPSAVQGEEAPKSIAARIRQANVHALADVLIVGRGGGSPEDLLAFSDEAVVRAIADSAIPVISAVGHEIDWSIADLAADMRAATPSAAAELVSEQGPYILREIAQHQIGLRASITERMDEARGSLDTFTADDVESRWSRLSLPYARRLDETGAALARNLDRRLSDTSHRVETAALRLESAHPKSILARGYSLVRRGKGKSGALVTCAAELAPGELVHIEFARGEAEAEVREVSI